MSDQVFAPASYLLLLSQIMKFNLKWLGCCYFQDYIQHYDPAEQQQSAHTLLLYILRSEDDVTTSSVFSGVRLSKTLGIHLELFMPKSQDLLTTALVFLLFFSFFTEDVSTSCVSIYN